MVVGGTPVACATQMKKLLSRLRGYIVDVRGIRVKYRVPGYWNVRQTDEQPLKSINFRW